MTRGLGPGGGGEGWGAAVCPRQHCWNSMFATAHTPDNIIRSPATAGFPISTRSNPRLSATHTSTCRASEGKAKFQRAVSNNSKFREIRNVPGSKIISVHPKRTLL